MYKIKKMKYKSVIKNGDETSSVSFEGNGTIHNSLEGTHIYMENGQEHFEFIFKMDSLVLKQNKSMLKFRLHNKVSNQYQVPYGTIYLDTYLEKMDVNDRGFKVVYNLYDKQSDEVLSRIYMQMMYLA